MNDKSFCFIICTNNDILLEECITYLNRLSVPEGYTVDLISVTDAKSMTSGYNEAMASSDAKYKIYMHQDVFIINEHFLYDLLSVFESDMKIGMIGMVGYERLSETGVMWREKKTGCDPAYGAKDAYQGMDVSGYRYSREDGFSDVFVADGLLLATSADIPWDEENFDGWDYYDASQCMRFHENGYRVVTPVQKYPWFIHDDGMYLTMFSYQKYRQRFMDIYERYLGKTVNDIGIEENETTEFV